MGLLLLFPPIWIVLMIIATMGALFRIKTEKRIWNDGTCRETGLPWQVKKNVTAETCTITSGPYIYVLLWLDVN